MKRICKLLCVLMVALVLVAPVTGVEAKKKTTTTTTTAPVKAGAVNVYVFYSPTCPHCADLHTFLDELKEDKEYKDLFNVVDYDVATSDTNRQLWQKVGEYFEVNVDGVPFYVIGDQYYEGFGDSAKDTLKTAIKNAANDKKYRDVVDGIGKGEITKTISEEKGEKKGNNVVGMVILAITVVIIIILIVCSSKNKYYDDEEDDDDDVEEETVKEEVVEETKKANSAKTTSTKAKASAPKKTTTKANATKKTNTTKANNNKSTTTKNTKTTSKKKA